MNVSDIHIDDKQFYKKLTQLVLSSNLINDHSKKSIIYDIRQKKIFVSLEGVDECFINNLSEYIECISYRNNKSYKDNFEHERNENDSDNRKESYTKEATEDWIKFSSTEKKEIYKYLILFTGIIFLITFIFTSVIKVLFNFSQNNTIFFVNTIIILVLLLPVLINGILHYDDFDKQNKSIFYLLSVGYALVFINFICITGNML